MIFPRSSLQFILENFDITLLLTREYLYANSLHANELQFRLHANEQNEISFACKRTK